MVDHLKLIMLILFSLGGLFVVCVLSMCVLLILHSFSVFFLTTFLSSFLLWHLLKINQELAIFGQHLKSNVFPPYDNLEQFIG